MNWATGPLSPGSNRPPTSDIPAADPILQIDVVPGRDVARAKNAKTAKTTS